MIRQANKKDIEELSILRVEHQKIYLYIQMYLEG